MAHADPRQQALTNLQQVLQGRALDQVLAAPTRLSARDQALVAEFSYGLCRWYRQLDTVVARYVRKPLRRKDQVVRYILLLGAYQLLYSRVPDHAVLATSVALTRRLAKPWAAGLVNGVLRQLQRDLQAGISLTEDTPAVRYAQPDWLLKQMQAAYPQDWATILDALQQRAPMTLRLNSRRQSLPDYLAALSAAGMSGVAVESVPGAVVLEQPTAVEQIPGFAEGIVSVQDAGAQLAAQWLDVQPGQRILDACAAPGGKTGHLLELAAGAVDLVAVDRQADRMERVADNLQRLQLHAQCEVLDASQPPAVWRQQPFDRILLDVPCSATGVMRRHPDIRLLRRADDIPALVQRQAALLRAVWPCLKVGGMLLYVTCSVLPTENQHQIMAFIQQYPDAHPVPMHQAWGHACSVGRQIYPGEQTMDGFYYALLTKGSSHFLK